ncbi:MAG: TIGR00296 family protein [Methanosarcinaceae archaeon]|nr:TIGR00296 family protein [Methanosarcinaceae archaeon]
MLTKEEGDRAVHLARDTIEVFLVKGTVLSLSDVDLSDIFSEKRGVFVTLTKQGMLRGCIGYPYPDSPLGNAIIDSAISAATRDPRFPTVNVSEMDDIIVEVTVLTQPELINVQPHELPEIIEIGKHGLIVKEGHNQGLLLPQVAPENNFDEVEFLDHTCLKAGLSPDAWQRGAQVYWFEGQIFKEALPRGNVMEENFKNMCGE